jgi:biotin transporter BioY
MRSQFSEALLGIGGILLSFAFTIIIIGYFAHLNTNTRAEFPGILSLFTEMAVGGAVLFAAGYLLQRTIRRDDGTAEPQRRSA